MLDPADSAEDAGLRYVSDAAPGIERRRAGRGFTYIGLDGKRLTDRAKLAWIRSLAIPPAWTDVWVCSSRNGHLQATGRDARGRKQYRYHPRWRTRRDEVKYDRVLAFGKALPRMRRRVARDLHHSGLPRERVLAAVVRLLEKTGIRVGNEEYARDNKSYGLTTLRGRHAQVGSKRIRFRFRGKGGKAGEVEISDARLARVVGRCQDLPGQELFAYLDEHGEVRSIGSGDVNAYLAEISGHDFTAKDFRTWAGTVLAAQALAELGPADSATESRRNVVRAVERVADWLNNTPAISRKAYVHPDVIDAYVEGDIVQKAALAADEATTAPLPNLAPYEAEVLALLRRRVAKAQQRPKAGQAAFSRRRARR
jgi:DNA topoisomerase-1